MNVRSAFSLVACATLGCAEVGDDARAAFVQDVLVDDNRIWLYRDAAGVADKFEVMASDRYDFMRGSAALHFAELARPTYSGPVTRFLNLPEATEVLLFGDPHPENATVCRAAASPTEPVPPLTVEFVDLDAAGYGPWTLDLRRLALGMSVLLAELPGCDLDCRQAAMRALARGYAVGLESGGPVGVAVADAGSADGWGAWFRELFEESLAEGAAQATVNKYAPANPDGARSMWLGDESGLVTLTIDRSGFSLNSRHICPCPTTFACSMRPADSARASPAVWPCASSCSGIGGSMAPTTTSSCRCEKSSTRRASRGEPIGRWGLSEQPCAGHVGSPAALEPTGCGSAPCGDAGGRPLLEGTQLVILFSRCRPCGGCSGVVAGRHRRHGPCHACRGPRPRVGGESRAHPNPEWRIGPVGHLGRPGRGWRCRCTRSRVWAVSRADLEADAHGLRNLPLVAACRGTTVGCGDHARRGDAVSSLACLVLTTPLIPVEMDRSAKELPPACVQVGADVAGRFQTLTPRVGVYEGFSLQRSRFESGLGLGGAGAREIWGGVRSGGQDSYIGVAGESIVPQVQVAEAHYRSTRLGLAVSMGLVDDPWVVTGNNAWDLRSVAPGLGEGAGWLERSDLGATLAWTSPEAWATVAVTSSSGEGLARRERNAGQNTSGLVIIRPLVGLGDAELLTVQGYYRDGSRGLGRIHDHRAGVRLTHRSAWAAGGAAWLKADGVGGDGDRQPVGTSVYGQFTPPTLPVLAYLRRDRIDEASELEKTDRRTVLAGVGLELPPEHDERPPMRLLVGWSRTSTDARLRTLPGAAAEAGSGPGLCSSTFGLAPRWVMWSSPRFLNLKCLEAGWRTPGTSMRTELACILSLALATACSDAEDDTGRGPLGAADDAISSATTRTIQRPHGW